MAAAAKRRALARSRKLSDATARNLRSVIVHKEKEDAKTALIAREMALHAMVHAKRLAFDQILTAKANANDALCEAAADRHALHLRKKAKVSALRSKSKDRPHC